MIASSPVGVKALRERLWVNGFRPVAVLNSDKRPSGKEWPDRARRSPPEAAVQWPESSALSTGILCDGLAALDIDIDDPALVSSIIGAAWKFLGQAPKRIRSNSSRCLLLYRAAQGEPKKRILTGSLGKVEMLGLGQQFVAYGFHKETGQPYAWQEDSSPDTFHRKQLRPITEDAVTAFLAAIAPLLGAEPPAPPPARPAETVASPSVNPAAVTERDVAYAAHALAAEIASLESLTDGRNAALNAAAHSLGTLASNGSLDPVAAAYALLEASHRNGHVSKHGLTQTKATIDSGFEAGMKKPRPLITQVETPDIDISGLMPKAQPTKSVPPKANGKRSVSLLQGSQIEAKPIEWLWDGFLPKGKLTLLAGAGGTGKSTLAFSIAGTITMAGRWPDGSICQAPGNVLIWSSEDDPADTIKPRLMATGAEASRYGIIAGTVDENGARDVFDAARDMQALRKAVTRIGGVSLLIIDPIGTAVTGDMHKANDVRRSLQAIVDFAAECNCAVLGITHFAKGTAGKNSAERVIGSQAFAALARMVLVAAKEEDSDMRVFTRAKSNNSVDTGGFGYTIEPITLPSGIIATRVVWGAALEGSSRSILAAIEGEEGSDSSQRGKAKHFLLQQLSHGATSSKELFEHAKETLGISPDTLRRAKDELGIVARKAGLGGWVWEKPSDPALHTFKHSM